VKDKYVLPENATREEVEATMGGLLNEVGRQQRTTHRVAFLGAILTGVFGLMSYLVGVGTDTNSRKVDYGQRLTEQPLPSNPFYENQRLVIDLRERIEQYDQAFLDAQHLLWEGAYDSKKYHGARDLVDNYIVSNRITHARGEEK
jgi:hypothetical protein